MVTQSLPLHLAQAINNCTVSLQHQRSFLNYIGTNTHTGVETLALSQKYGHESKHLGATCLSYPQFEKLFPQNQNLFVLPVASDIAALFYI